MCSVEPKNQKFAQVTYINRGIPGSYLNSLSTLFSVIPNLERLKLPCNSSNHLDIKPPALSNLNYFSLTHAQDLNGISKITEASKNTLKFIELNFMEQVEGLQQVLEPIKDTIEGLFSQWVIGQFDQTIRDLNFSKLRVIGTHYMPYPPGPTSDLSWLEVSMFKNVRTIIADLDRSQEYWLSALKLGGIDVLKKVPNLKHMVFTTYIGFFKRRNPT